ncbi:hypothetical protein [Sinomonas sp.]|jgi:hypothetical protein|uniref:hypothetical protein n=1 Tax=Sinomonas sp. TaxID=1914986 RepID=UPI003F7ED68A
MSNDQSGIHGHVSWVLTDENGVVKAQGETDNLVTDTGDQYYAARAAQIQGSALTITAIATGTTAVVTTSAAHGLSVGDAVTIAGVTPSGYNGKWAVTAVGSSTTFSIYVGTALGAGTAFGTATGLSVSLASGMKLGQGSTAVAKSGAGAALVTYLSGSQQAFDATYPTAVDTAGSGSKVTYKVTYAAGTATTASAITEAVIVNENILANATTAAANTISRVLLTGIGSKGASDTLTITWSHTLLGA